MPDTPPSGPFPGSSPPGSPAAVPSWPPVPPKPVARSGRWPAFLALAIALVGLGVGIGAWLRPVPKVSQSSAPVYSEEQIATAKAEVCEAYRVVDRAVVVNTHRANPVPGDEIGALATGAHGIAALYDGGDYLLDRLMTEPATPGELANLVKSLGTTLKKFGIVVLAGAPESERDELRQAVDTDSTTIESLCK